MWYIVKGLFAMSLTSLLFPLEYVKMGARPKARIAITIYQGLLLMVLMTMVTAGKFDHLFHLGHLLQNFANAMVLAMLLTSLAKNVKWLKMEKPEDWVVQTCETLKVPIEWLVEYIWESVLALDVELVNVDEEPEPENEEKHNEPTVKDIVEKLSNTFYLNDTQVLTPHFAHIIRRDYSNLVDTYIMIRAAKTPKFFSSVNLERGLGEIMGFLPLKELMIVAEKNKYETYQIWEAVADKYLTYEKAVIISPSTTFSEAEAHFDKHAFKVAIVREYPTECGVLSYEHLMECKKRYEKTVRQHNNICKKKKRSALAEMSSGSLALQKALRKRLVQATIKDINKEAYEKAIND